MKFLKHKIFSQNVISIMAAIAIMFVALFSFISAFGFNSESDTTTLVSQKTNAISNYDAPLNNEVATQSIANALDFVSITQTDVVLNENNFRQITIQTTTPDENEPTNPDKYTINSEKVANIVYVVGAFTIWPQTELVADQEKCKAFKFSIMQLDTTTFVEDIEHKTEITYTSESDKDNPIISKAAPISGDALYEITITYTTGNPPDETNNIETFYIYQAPKINYENYGFIWQKHTTSDTNISYPVEGQIYDSGYNSETGASIDGYLVLKLDFNAIKTHLNKYLNSLYIDFWHNGQAFSIRIAINSDGDGLDFYNNYSSQFDGITIKGLTIADNDGKLDTASMKIDDIYTIKFNESGEYKVRIYDNTLNRVSVSEEGGIATMASLNGSPTTYTDGIKDNIYAPANFMEHNFTVVNRSKLDGFYATAKTQNAKGEQLYIVNEIDRNSWRDEYRYMQQRTNKNVLVDFYNTRAIKSISCSQYSTINSDVINKRTNLDITTDPTHVSATITNEGDYYFDIEFKETYDIVLTYTTKSGLSYITTTYTYLENITHKTIGFQVLKGVRDQYDFLHINNGTMQTKRYPEAADVLDINKVLVKNLNQNFAAYNNDTCSYIFFEGLGDQLLFGSNDSSFVLNIAQSSPSISGIANNKSTNESVSLTFTGVATSEVGINITVYKDGKNFKNYTIYNQNSNEPLKYELSYSDLGSYKVVLTDAMNNSTEVRFAITQPKNAASIILIAIGAALAAAVVFLIIKTRSKVSVR